MSADPFLLERFLTAQDANGVYERALGELGAGRKSSHWMWFVFPQLAGLAHSEMSVRYAISGIGEARAYLEHPLLGARLRECARALLDLRGDDAVAVMGAVDALKLRSSMTLFAAVAAGEPVFSQVLARYFSAPDDATLALLAQRAS